MKTTPDLVKKMRRPGDLADASRPNRRKADKRKPRKPSDTDDEDDDDDLTIIPPEVVSGSY